jgi:beta-lactam-binding protein with PASTA domain
MTTVTVPDFTGLNIYYAIEGIASAGLVPGGNTYINSLTVPLTTVISQNPVGGATANLSDPVYLTISLGPAVVPVQVVVP